MVSLAEIANEKRVISEEIKHKLPQNLPLFTLACNWSCISSKAGAQLVTAFLEYLNVLTAENEQAVADKSKVVLESFKSRKQISLSRKFNFLGISFDGHKDETFKECRECNEKCKKIAVLKNR